MRVKEKLSMPIIFLQLIIKFEICQNFEISIRDGNSKKLVTNLDLIIYL